MHKLIAIVNVIAWAGFWAFGYIALTTHAHNTQDMMIALGLAVLGGGLGLWAWFKLVRHNEATGYAKPPNRANRSHLEDEFKGENV